MITLETADSLLGKYIVNPSDSNPSDSISPKKVLRIIDAEIDDLRYVVQCADNFSYSIDFLNDNCLIVTKEQNPEYFL